MNLEEIYPIIERIFKEALEERTYRYGLPNPRGISNKIASGRLRDSIRAVPEPNAIGIEMLDYGKWVNSGRMPGKKGVPIDALILWIKQRGIRARDKNGKLIPPRSLAFGIQKKIKQYGIPALPGWYDVAFDKLYNNKQIDDLLGEATIDELIDTIEGI